MPANAASAFDAISLIAYGLEISGARGGSALAEGGVRRALEALRAGERPDLLGATGPLTYDETVGIDLIAGTLSRFVVEDARSA